MTQNQIKYQELEEERRHNQAVEREQKRTNAENERIKAEQNAINAQHYLVSDTETIRSNQARETENTRHNTSTEQIDWFKNYETQRHDKEQEAISWFEAKSENLKRQSDISVNEANIDLTKEKTQSEPYNRLSTFADTQLSYAKRDLTKAQTETERWNRDVAYTNAAYNTLRIQTYNSDRIINALSGAQSNFGNIFGAATHLYGTLESVKAKAKN